jgi:cobalamin biosynthesis protein CobT
MSGSMASAKSTYARDAAFLIASALQYSDVPFELSYFATDMSGNSLNGIVKTFDEPLTTIAKQKIAMMDMRQSRKLGHTYFECAGTSNIDESAIFSVTNRFQERHEKTKLLIVLSDGATCGSESLLKLVVDSLPDYGIDVFGVGLYSDVVAKIYTDHILIDNNEDLQKLPKTLMDVVLRNVSTVL